MTTADEERFRFYDDVEDGLRDAVRAVLDENCPLPAVAARYDAAAAGGEQALKAAGDDRALWALLGGQLGVAGLLIPEEFGGAGATAREMAVVLEETGRAVAPVPVLTSAVWGTSVLLGLAGPAADVAGGAAGEPARAAVRALLADLAAGRRTVGVAARADAAPGGHQAVSAAEPDGSGGAVVTGTVRSVVGVRDADVFLVPVALEHEPALVLVDGARFGRVAVVSLDESRALMDLEFDGTPGTVLAVGDAAVAAFEGALTVTVALLASEQLGVAARCLEETVAYVKTRHQFGRPIGGFQAVKHRLADLWAQIEGARTAARYAATCVAVGSPDTEVAAAVAQAYCTEAAVRAAEECVQLHGGIGFTWEHPAHLWLKRAMAQAVMFGGAEGARGRVARLAGLAAEPAK